MCGAQTLMSKCDKDGIEASGREALLGLTDRLDLGLGLELQGHGACLRRSIANSSWLFPGITWDCWVHTCEC